MRRTRIKVCGLTRREDASAAMAAGAFALGVVLAPSKRQVTLEQAEEVLRGVPGSFVKVGVFVDPDIEELREAARRLQLDAVQLHGSEPPELCSAVPQGVAVMKAIRVGSAFDASALEQYRGVVEALLLDTLVPGQDGGTGTTFDWRLIAGKLPLWAMVCLAGGLTPENVGEAIAVVHPTAVDVSSGVEDVPGVKNHELIRRFTAAVRAADEESARV